MTYDFKIRLSLFFVIALTGLAVFLAWPVLKDIARTSEQLLVERNNLFSLEAKINNLQRFDEEYQKLKPDLEKADSLLVEADLPVDFIRFLEEASAESNVSLKISPSSLAKNAKDPWPGSGFQLSLAGSYPEIVRFVDKLENGPYLAVLRTINFSQEFNRLSSGDIKGSIAIKVYVR